jgi:hypothetical protein
MFDVHGVPDYIACCMGPLGAGNPVEHRFHTSIHMLTTEMIFKDSLVTHPDRFRHVQCDSL